eukprot:s2_g17.t1
MRVVAGRLVEISDQSDAQALSNAAWWAVFAGAGPVKSAEASGLALRAQAASNIAWAATQAASHPPEIRDALKDLTLSATKEANVLELSQLAWAVATLQISEQALTGELAHAAHAKLAGSRAPELAGMAWAPTTAAQCDEMAPGRKGSSQVRQAASIPDYGHYCSLSSFLQF